MEVANSTIGIKTYKTESRKSNHLCKFNMSTTYEHRKPWNPSVRIEQPLTPYQPTTGRKVQRPQYQQLMHKKQANTTIGSQNEYRKHAKDKEKSWTQLTSYKFPSPVKGTNLKIQCNTDSSNNPMIADVSKTTLDHTDETVEEVVNISETMPMRHAGDYSHMKIDSISACTHQSKNIESKSHSACARHTVFDSCANFENLISRICMWYLKVRTEIDTIHVRTDEWKGESSMYQLISGYLNQLQSMLGTHLPNDLSQTQWGHAISYGIRTNSYCHEGSETERESKKMNEYNPTGTSNYSFSKTNRCEYVPSNKGVEISSHKKTNNFTLRSGRVNNTTTSNNTIARNDFPVSRSLYDRMQSCCAQDDGTTSTQLEPSCPDYGTENKDNSADCAQFSSVHWISNGNLICDSNSNNISQFQHNTEETQFQPCNPVSKHQPMVSSNSVKFVNCNLFENELTDYHPTCYQVQLRLFNNMQQAYNCKMHTESWTILRWTISHVSAQVKLPFVPHHLAFHGNMTVCESIVAVQESKLAWIANNSDALLFHDFTPTSSLMLGQSIPIPSLNPYNETHDVALEWPCKTFGKDNIIRPEHLPGCTKEKSYMPLPDPPEEMLSSDVLRSMDVPDMLLTGIDTPMSTDHPIPPNFTTYPEVRDELVRVRKSTTPYLLWKCASVKTNSYLHD